MPYLNSANGVIFLHDLKFLSYQGTKIFTTFLPSFWCSWTLVHITVLTYLVWGNYFQFPLILQKGCRKKKNVLRTSRKGYPWAASRAIFMNPFPWQRLTRINLWCQCSTLGLGCQFKSKFCMPNLVWSSDSNVN